MIDLTHEPDLGYIFYPPETPDHPGHPRLDVVIPAQPTYRHFDPENALFYVVASPGNIEHLSVHHPWTMGKAYRVCAGRILLADRKKKRVEAFSFGGDLQIESNEDETVCALVSAAPIFPLLMSHDLSTWIAAEMEVLLAERRADWDPEHPLDFESHLATVDVITLYASCLNALQEKFAEPVHFDLLTHQGVEFVQLEIKRLQQAGEWPWSVPPLTELL